MVFILQPSLKRNRKYSKLGKTAWQSEAMARNHTSVIPHTPRYRLVNEWPSNTVIKVITGPGSVCIALQLKSVSPGSISTTIRYLYTSFLPCIPPSILIPFNLLDNVNIFWERFHRFVIFLTQIFSAYRRRVNCYPNYSCSVLHFQNRTMHTSKLSFTPSVRVPSIDRLSKFTGCLLESSAKLYKNPTKLQGK